jgi:hypothetical protein
MVSTSKRPVALGWLVAKTDDLSFQLPGFVALSVDGVPVIDLGLGDLPQLACIDHRLDPPA